MSTQGLLKTGRTIEPGIELLGGLAVAKTESGESLGARIAQFRKDRGLTQAELAERLAVSQPVVSDYENDVIRIPADVVVQLAEILNVSTDELLGLKADTRKNGTVKNRRLLRQVQAMEKLSKRDQQALLRTIEAFLSKAG
jgi:transcriptional regulator with XRE-family HTH domain